MTTGIGWYTIAVIVISILIIVSIHYASAHFSENIRKLLIIASLFLIIGIATGRDNFKK